MVKVKRNNIGQIKRIVVSLSVVEANGYAGPGVH